MNPIKIATVQFEHRSGDKAYNLSVIEQLTKKASLQGAQAIVFHECSITGYSFARHLVKK
ncbi:MAG: nitrilase, partial [Bacteroidota bacterium]|nr:nitrilase [Bacteroidota bacterium]